MTVMTGILDNRALTKHLSNLDLEFPTTSTHTRFAMARPASPEMIQMNSRFNATRTAAQDHPHPPTVTPCLPDHRALTEHLSNQVLRFSTAGFLTRSATVNPAGPKVAQANNRFGSTRTPAPDHRVPSVVAVCLPYDDALTEPRSYHDFECLHGADSLAHIAATSSRATNRNSHWVFPAVPA